jgi:glycogen operon protein
MPKARVVPMPGPATPGPRTPWPDTVIYEMHLKGFTQRHPAVPEHERGTVAGLECGAVIDYLRSLGITAIELLPVHAFASEAFLRDRGLVNYWGYNTLSWFTPHGPYVGDGGGLAFRRLVDRLHDAGLEVILDVVYNHSAEGSHTGPTLSLRGIDNLTYYRLEHGAPARYVNDTGCGNTLAADHPAVRRLIMDSLRYWAGGLGVDGFRFDLGPALARSAHGFDAHSALLRQISDDPVLGRCKLISEPWDVGPGGYRLGGFPAGWSEWNDRYRDSLRRFWRGDDGEAPELATRFHGSGDLFEHDGRAPWASINFVTSHDGFSLRDLVSYSRRHNRDNGEGNRDGHAENFSDNCGVEGPTGDPAIIDRRRRRERNLLATLVLSQGVPMLQAGDELGRTQRGNNNAYCQDNEISWIDWDSADGELTRFLKALLRFRRGQPLLRADRYRHTVPDAEGQSMHWVAPEGGLLDGDEWHLPDRFCVGCLLTQDATEASAPASLLTVMNAGARPVEFKLPGEEEWYVRIDTAEAPWHFDERAVARSLAVPGQSLLVLEQRR